MDERSLPEFIQKLEELRTAHHTRPQGFHRPHPHAAQQQPHAAPAPIGARRALLIGINYFGQGGELSGCHNDVKHVQEWLLECGFGEMMVLLDSPTDPRFERADCPTRDNIVNAVKTMVSKTREGDYLYVHYSGHGSYLPAKTGDEDDRNDEAWCPVDYDWKKEDNGYIRDNDLYKLLVEPLPHNARLRVVSDSCHSGSMLDLPFMMRSELKFLKAGVRGFVPRKNIDVVLISGCKDSQTSADSVFNDLPQGACTWAFLAVMKKLAEKKRGGGGAAPTWESLVGLMREELVTRGYSQIPQLSVQDKEELGQPIDLLPM